VFSPQSYPQIKDGEMVDLYIKSVFYRGCLVEK